MSKLIVLKMTVCFLMTFKQVVALYICVETPNIHVSLRLCLCVCSTSQFKLLLSSVAIPTCIYMYVHVPIIEWKIALSDGFKIDCQSLLFAVGMNLH